MRKAAGRRGLLHARGDVDGDAADAAVGIDAAAEQHAAGVDADAHVEAGVAVRGLHFGAERLAEFEQRQPATHRALGVVFARFVGAEGGQHAVAGVLQHLAAVRLDDGSDARRAPSITALISSGSRCWLSAVEPTTSRNRMVTCLSA